MRSTKCHQHFLSPTYVTNYFLRLENERMKEALLNRDTSITTCNGEEESSTDFKNYKSIEP